ncbi:imidazole glycerol phosphate synthase subunit HisH [Desulfuribacillus alkaliarsenatis]|uniref:Imidazole glycerol phosphate synthase subunit HisH n=1 Tax=Desulfuribacillus alkaliarsenatis TaxID=766136 RepID=A0A1E5G421_9FIRM|nr:imidazole glycerol phosphate synthase subunit HisH [Desulfuribacillus alkaliarsenatis]OEF97841.1 imidazole glycerol phosphate synthase, glutamine amidotransferase subunit [Desulfuribacillus alkaliarsenatis]
MIAVIDYGMGNLRSVTKALEKLGYEPQIVDKPGQLKDANGVILPGVGAFGDAMENLQTQNFIPAIKEFINTGKPFLGICLGMQLLFDSSNEMGEHQGLGLIPGKVVRFQGNFKVPQMGWNQLQLHDDNHYIFNNISTGGHVYFVHSYHAKVDNPDHVLATTDYHSDVTAIVGRDNIVGMQFHPEKSSEVGLQLLRNFGERCSSE